jgi:hypothetical protein
MFSFPESNYEIIADDNLGVKYSMVWNLKEILKKNETHT